MTVIDKYSLNEILLQWSKINDAGAKGEVLGYEISYWIIELNFELVQSSEKKYIYVYAPNRTATLKELRPFAKYAFQIAAFTEGGIGLISIKYYGGNNECIQYRLDVADIAHRYKYIINQSIIQLINQSINQ